MVDCVIHPILLVESKIDKSLMTYCLNFGQTIPSVAYVWYIEGLKERILVDAYDSVLRIKETADMIVPIHDPEFQKKKGIP